MAQRVFIKVIGFTDVERHALNTVFRLSEERDTQYTLVTEEQPEAPQLALLDGQAHESHVQAESPANAKLKLVWIGDNPPANAWRAFRRPLAWTDVVQAMDQLFAPADIDFDLAFDEEPGGPDTQPSQLEEAEPGKRALIASPDRDERLYLRARLALAHLTQADEAETAAQALELMRGNAYSVVLVDFALPGTEGWQFLKQLREGQPAIPHVIVTKHRPTLGERVRAWMAGAEGFFDKPPHPAKLEALLQKV
jgi:CheY-like chemotaxis protein